MHYCVPVAVYALGQWCRNYQGFDLPTWPLPLMPRRRGRAGGLNRPLLPPELLAATVLEETDSSLRMRLGNLLLDPTHLGIALVLHIPLAHGTLDLLGLVHLEPLGSRFGLKMGSLAVLLQGGAVAVLEAADYIKPARKWWDRFGNFKLQYSTDIGRPVDSGLLDHYTFFDLQDEYRKLAADHRRQRLRPPTQEQFASALRARDDSRGVSVDTLRKRLAEPDCGQRSWDEFRASCQ
jgi:hypothetical protein